MRMSSENCTLTAYNKVNNGKYIPRSFQGILTTDLCVCIITVCLCASLFVTTISPAKRLN